MRPGLGTKLRQLTEALDRAVDEAYRSRGLDFRARYFPYVQLLIEGGELAVGAFAARLGYSQPAVTQTLGLMRKAGLVESIAAADRRERRYRLTAKATAMLPELERLWAAIARAAAALDTALPAPLEATLSAALQHLSKNPFLTMIDQELRDA